MKTEQIEKMVLKGGSLNTENLMHQLGRKVLGNEYQENLYPLQEKLIPHTAPFVRVTENVWDVIRMVFLSISVHERCSYKSNRIWQRKTNEIKRRRHTKTD